MSMLVRNVPTTDAEAKEPWVSLDLARDCLLRTAYCLVPTADRRLPTAMPDSLEPQTRRGEPWALSSVTGYALANLFDRVAVTHADPLIGPLVRGLPSLLLGMALVWKNRTLTQLVPNSRDYVGTRVLLSLVGAGAVSTAGLFAYYFAIRMGGVTIT